MEYTVGMVKITARIALMTAALYGGITYLDGVALGQTQDYGFLVSFITVMVVFAVIEIAIHPLLNLVILPLRLLTFGIASILLSVVLVYFVSLLVPFFESSLIGAIVMGLAFGVIRSLTK